MADNFEYAFQVILEHEGKTFTLDPADPGGATRYGITLRAAQEHWGKAHVTVQFMRDLTETDAKAYYLSLFCKGFDHIEGKLAATKYFDACINMGTHQGTLLAQRAVNALGGPTIDVDGKPGVLTLGAISNAPEGLWVAQMALQMAAFYDDLATRKPALQKFLKGWLKRANWGVV